MSYIHFTSSKTEKLVKEPVLTGLHPKTTNEQQCMMKQANEIKANTPSLGYFQHLYDHT